MTEHPVEAWMQLVSLAFLATLVSMKKVISLQNSCASRSNNNYICVYTVSFSVFPFLVINLSTA